MCIADMKSKQFGTTRHTWPIIKCTRTGSRKKHLIRGTDGQEDGVNTNKRKSWHQVHELVLREKCPFPVEQPPRGRYIAHVFVYVCVCVCLCVCLSVCVCLALDRKGGNILDARGNNATDAPSPALTSLTHSMKRILGDIAAVHCRPRGAISS